MKEYDMNNEIINELYAGKGYIKEYNKKDNLFFECQYLNGEKNGKCKIYYGNGILLFEGEY